jgi:hypothetical protein
MQGNVHARNIIASIRAGKKNGFMPAVRTPLSQIDILISLAFTPSCIWLPFFI